MGINKPNSLYSGDKALGGPLLALSLADHTELVAETSHIISTLRPSLETRRLAVGLREVEQAIESAGSLEELSKISATLSAIRIETRRACRRSATAGGGSWQSPAMESSLDPAVSRDAQPLVESGIDYHRTAHVAGINYEKRFVASLIGHRDDCRVLATTSGMGAISVALQFLSSRMTELAGPIVVDDGCYHETRFLAESLFRSRLRYLDLTTPDAIASLKSAHPSLIIFDSTRNSSSIRALPVTDILAAAAETGAYLLVDSTSLVSAEPILAAARECGVLSRTLVATSLAKMHQYGMDLVTAGMLFYGSALESEFPGPKAFRTHLGLNITEDSALTLPALSAPFLRQRAARISRNVAMLSAALCAAQAQLSVATAMCWGETDLYAPYFNVSLSQGDEVAWYREFMRRAMAGAKQRGVPLIAGTSFGFDVTRIYLVESLIPSHHPFIRVSPGMESAHEAAVLAQVLAEAAQGETL